MLNEITLSMTDAMRNTLDKFFSEKTVVDVDRNTFLVCNLDDPRLKIKISIVFMRDWDSIESDSFNSVIMENKGAVFTFPCYWVSIPKELTMTYFEFIINDFYTDEVSKWDIAKNYINESGVGSTTNENCGCSCNIQKNPSVQQTPCKINMINV